MGKSKKRRRSPPKLNPCPKCGSSAYIQRDITGKKKYHACCNGWGEKYKCPLYAGIIPWSDTEEEAAAVWNAQAQQTAESGAVVPHIVTGARATHAPTASSSFLGM